MSKSAHQYLYVYGLSICLAVLCLCLNLLTSTMQLGVSEVRSGPVGFPGFLHHLQSASQLQCGCGGHGQLHNIISTIWPCCRGSPTCKCLGDGDNARYSKMTCEVLGYAQLLCRRSSNNRLVGLVVKSSASRVEDSGFESRLRWDFFPVESYP